MRVSEQDWTRFLTFVLPPDANGCTLWDGAQRNTYGQFRVRGLTAYAHRVAYAYWFDSIPRGHEIDHKFSAGCRSKLCVNPDHLEAVTHAVNMRRSHAARRWMATIRVWTELDGD